MKVRIIGRFVGQDHGTVYPCSECGVDTRDTGHGELGAELCAECQDTAEVEERHEAEGHEDTKGKPTCPRCMSDPVKVRLTLATFQVFPSFKRKLHMVQVTKEQVMVTGERKVLLDLAEVAAENNFGQEEDVPLWFYNTARAACKTVVGALFPNRVGRAPKPVTPQVPALPGMSTALILAVFR